MKIRFFKTAPAFRKWLQTNHHTAQELWVGFYKRTSGLPSMTWPESVDQALCFGWIDGIRKRIDENSYVIRFTPRRPSSVWSAINTKRAQELANDGLMHAAGLKAFGARRENRSGIYSYENRPVELPDPYAKTIKQNKAAWEFLQAQPPSYRKLVCWWIVSAKKEETRAKRIEKLIAVSAQGRRL